MKATPALVLLALVGSTLDRAAADRAPDLTGRWKLNAERSDDAREKMREASDGERRGKAGLGGIGPLAPGPRGGGPMGGGPMGSRPMGGRPGGRARGTDAAEGGAGPADLLNPPETLVITQEGNEVTLDGGGDNLLRLRTDGRKVKRDGGALEVKARFKDDELVLDMEREDGARVVTTYGVTSDRQELHVTSRVEGPLDEVVVRRVYDAAPPE